MTQPPVFVEFPDAAMNAAHKPITLITGASSGIGEALAEVFAARGHALVLAARRVPTLEALAGGIAALGQARPDVLGIDLGLPDAGERIAAALDTRGLAVQNVVNNAGFGLLGPAADSDRATQLSMIDVNVRALTDLSLRFIGSIAEHQGGILNVASIGGFMPGPNMAVYHATKAYALSFSEALHHELRPRGVKVSVLCPGPVKTEFLDRAGIPQGHFPNVLMRSAERVARDGYEGLMRNQRVVVPGVPNKVMTILPRFLPRALMFRMVGGF
jgi:short-subunit dehydrogenase